MIGMIQTFLSALKLLEDNHIAYMIVGSVASTVYGEPRMTRDMDLVIRIPVKDAYKLEDIFSSETFYCPPLEILKSEIIHHGQFNLIHHDSGLKIDIIICKETEHALCEFQRRRKVPILENQSVYIASPEDVIIKKLDYFRQGGSSKHLQDVRGILAETSVDESYLHSWITKLGLNKEWERASNT